MSDSDVLTEKLTNGTVLGNWFQPFNFALDKVRFSPKRFGSLSMKSFVLFNCARQIKNTATMREQLQTLWHLDTDHHQLPVKCPTYCDALGSTRRRDILRESLGELIASAQAQLPDRLRYFQLTQ